MIVVIADDFTGAAELAGISLQYGLTVELCCNKVEYKNADVLVVCTNSRSLSKTEAIGITAKVIEGVSQLHPTLLYKKIDSVLRGYVIDEVKVQMQFCKINTALILPCNPSLGRVIVEGEYFINNKKITDTDFVNDPEFPIKSSGVKQILNNEVEVLKTKDILPNNGIFIGEAATTEDLSIWADKNLSNLLLAGAGDFFTALLQKQFSKVESIEADLLTPFLYVCGSSFKNATDRVDAITQNASLINDINSNFLLIKSNNEKYVLAIKTAPSLNANQLRTEMAIITKQLIEDLNIKELFVEGGSTAASVLHELDIQKLQPINELARGVVRMKANDLFITVKPGSYDLPKQIKLLLTENTD